MPNIDMFHSMSVGGRYIPNANTVAYYKLDGNANDSSGNNNHGTASNVTYTTGQVNQAGSFNGTSSGILVPDAAIQRHGTNNFTISCWVKFTGSQNDKIIFRKDLDDLAPSMRGFYGVVTNTNGSVNFHTRRNGVAVATTSTILVNDNNWHNLIGVRNGSTVSLYVDGVFSSSASGGPLNLDTGGNIGIGRYTPSGGGYFNGLIDEIIIENKARTAQEVLNYYNTSK